MKGLILRNFPQIFENNRFNKSRNVTKQEKWKTEENIQQISFFTLFRFMKSIDLILVILGIISAVLSGILETVVNYFLASLIAEFIKFNSNTEEDLMKELINYVLLLTLLLILIIILMWLYFFLLNRSARKQIIRIRKKLFYTILNQDISWFDENITGDFAKKMSEDIEKTEEGIGEKLGLFIHYQTINISFLILSLFISWELSIICVILIILLYFSIYLCNKKNQNLSAREVKETSALGKIEKEVLSSIKTIAAFGGQNKEIIRYNEKLQDIFKIQLKRGLIFAIINGLTYSLSYSTIGFIFWNGVRLFWTESSIRDTNNIKTILICMLCIYRVYVFITASMPFLESFENASGAGAKIFQVISKASIDNKQKYKKKPDSIKGKIVFRNVCFNYPSRPDVPIIRGLNFVINQGETIALVGASGCGKSTCVQLIQRFYDLTSGLIYLDDNNIQDLDLSWLRSNIGVVSQEPSLFDATIEENIKFGKLNASQEEVEQAAKKAHAHEFILKLPLGYKTNIGECGTQLSGGQKQRIAIARALVRNPKILLLDEATSALDLNSETKVQTSIEENRKDRTTIIVAHRLSTIRNADRILVLSEGQIVEEGKHDELMTKQQVYYNLVTTQVKNICVTEGETNSNVYNKNLNLINDSLRVQEDNIKKSNKTQDNMIEDRIPKMIFWQILKANSPEWHYFVIDILAVCFICSLLVFYSIVYGKSIEILISSDVNYIKNSISTFSLYMVGVSLGISTFEIIKIFTLNLTGSKLIKRLRRKIFETMIKQEMSWFDKEENKTGTLCTKLSLHTNQLKYITGTYLGMFFQASLLFIVGFGMTLYYEYRISLAVGICVPLMLIGAIFKGTFSTKKVNDYQKMIFKANNLAGEVLSNIRTVASLGCEEFFFNSYKSYVSYSSSSIDIRNHLKGIVQGFVKALFYVSSNLCIYFGFILIKDENLPPSIVFAIMQISLFILNNVASCFIFYGNFVTSLQSAQEIFKILAIKSNIQEVPDVKYSIENQPEVWYNSIDFTYPSRPEIQILHKLSLVIGKGKTVALVGASGCGKTTIIQLLLRFYDPQLGQITIDEKNIKNIRIEDLRQQIGVVSQEATLFDRTIRENIAYGDNSRDVDQVEIIQAAQQANIHNFIVSLPEGYETILGEKGVKISGGQKQRIAIARALIRNPKILLLDEATSALDSKNEKIVQETLDKAKTGRTCITVAHRLSTIENADIICVLHQGKIVEFGTHFELLQNCGYYFNLYK